MNARPLRYLGCWWLICGFPSTVWAQPQLAPEVTHRQPSPPVLANQSPFEVELALDLSLTLGALIVLGLPRLFADEAVSPWCGLQCDREDVNPLDRRVIGKRDPGADLASDLGAGLSYGLPFVLDMIDVLISDPEDGFGGYGKDVVVLAETLSVTLALNNLLNFAVRRPRPLVYDPERSDDLRRKGDSSLSFPSGHTSASFAMATAYSRLFQQRHPDHPLVVPTWIATYGLAATTAVLRTEAGEHFYTDVIVGAVLGIGLGLLVPWLHQRPDPARATASEPTLGLVPLVLPSGGAGAALVIR